MSDKSSRAKKEDEILSFWKEKKIFNKSLAKDSPKGEFIFYEGPPTANGQPGIHHLSARVFKDAIPRYKTMRGYHVRRRAGWDTHGLPVELEVEKQLGLKSKREIEEYGVARFNEECRRNVWKYVNEWRNFTDRIGYWIDLDNPYITYHNSYMEAVWSILAEVEKRGLLYRDYKVVPWCPRCGTALSSHELAQGYRDVKEISVYVKFKLTTSSQQLATYLLAWTTTPWTLPGNVALAVGEDISYVEAKIGDEIYLLAKDRLSTLGEPYEIIANHKGVDLVGLEYEPLYQFLKDTNDKAYKVYVADFVNTEDGTGIVHTAVMYGQDDFILGTKVGLPKHHLVDESGYFTQETDFLAGKFVKSEETTVDIIKDLAHRNLLFKKEKHEHSYPHCWRCKTPLIYYARDSWYIRMSELRDELVRENSKINWEPQNIRAGRFGEWLREVKDWAISRERYWGTPLPIWQSESGERMVVDSINTLKKQIKRANNKYWVMRHGESTHNLTWSISTLAENTDTLTDNGRKQVRDSANELKQKGIDLLIISPFLRTQETARIIKEVLELSSGQVVEDDRLREFGVYSFEGKTWKEYHEIFPKTREYFDKHNKDDESYKDVKMRVMAVLKDCEKRYSGKSILFITHGGPAWLLSSGAQFLSEDEMYDMIDRKQDSHLDDLKNAQWRELDYIPLPHDHNFKLDLHRPYIDEVILMKDGEEYRRVKEVIDVWFDSGAVPFAQDAEEQRLRMEGDQTNFKNILYPADFISEAIDQTRGWFYTLHAIGILMGRGIAYRNVICLGHLLDQDGKKMSKSVGNALDPWALIERHGVDALRFWMYSVNQPGESKNFDERSVEAINKQVFNLLDNVYAFYELYKTPESKFFNSKLKSSNILDIWIIARLNELIDLTTSKLDEFKLLEPVREIREFINDLSTWYLRRSRERIKRGDEDAKHTLYFTLKELTKIISPFAPFIAEDLYQKLRNSNDVESVHLENWPSAGKIDRKVLETMRKTRGKASLILEARERAGIKIRQPLASAKASFSGIYPELVKEEVNVKELIDADIDGVEIDTHLTLELMEEGRMRETVRNIQDMRKGLGLKPGERMSYIIPTDLKELFIKYGREIKEITDIEIVDDGSY